MSTATELIHFGRYKLYQPLSEEIIKILKESVKQQEINQNNKIIKNFNQIPGLCAIPLTINQQKEIKNENKEEENEYNLFYFTFWSCWLSINNTGIDTDIDSLTSDNILNDLLTFIKDCKDNQEEEDKNNKLQLIIVMHGGGFSGAIYKIVKDKNTKKNTLQIITHKTFSFYVTRKKQGKRQLTKDNLKIKIKSIGSEIRRNQEKEFQLKLKDLILNKWNNYFKEIETIYLSCPGMINREMIENIFKELNLNFTKIKTIPFVVRKPNYKNVLESLDKIMTIHVMDKNYLNNDYFNLLNDSELTSSSSGSEGDDEEEERIEEEEEKKDIAKRMNMFDMLNGATSPITPHPLTPSPLTTNNSNPFEKNNSGNAIFRKKGFKNNELFTMMEKNINNKKNKKKTESIFTQYYWLFVSLIVITVVHLVLFLLLAF
ncbi:hypothetical protein ABK040_000451 [Willaertia magna]